MKCEKWTDQHDRNVRQRKIWVPDRNRIHDKHWTPDRHSILCIWIQLQLPCCEWVLVAKWKECPPGCQEVMGSSLLPGTQMLCHVDKFTFHIFLAFFHQFACSVKKKSHFLKTWQIYVVLLKEHNVMQDKKHMYLTIGLGVQDFGWSRPFNCDFSKQLQI